MYLVYLFNSYLVIRMLVIEKQQINNIHETKLIETFQTNKRCDKKKSDKLKIPRSIYGLFE